ncbi:substrate-binding domain-containing protein, partial [bacterium]|nr:substrate-binding domain-containing protein [bacterium]
IRNNVNKNIGLIIPNGETGILSQLTEIIEKEVYRRNYHIILCYSNFDFEKQENHASLLVEKKVCGVIFCPILSNKEYKRNERVIDILEKNGIPVVLIDMYLPGKDVDYVVSDNFNGAYEGTKYLISLGHKKIAFISSLLGSSIKERMDGYRKAMEENGIKIRDNWIKIPNLPDMKTGYRETFELLEGKEKPTAIFCAHDLIAMSCLQALNEMRVKIPEEISVLGFDNLPLSSLSHPPLTTISQNFKAIGEKAVEVLIEKVEGKNLKVRRYKIPAKLKIRETTGSSLFKTLKGGERE